MRPQIIERLRAGATVAVISDAGTPLVSDPGYKLVRDAIAAGIEVFAVPGPSAALAALIVSGLPTDRSGISSRAASRVAGSFICEAVLSVSINPGADNVLGSEDDVRTAALRDRGELEHRRASYSR